MELYLEYRKYYGDNGNYFQPEELPNPNRPKAMTIEDEIDGIEFPFEVWKLILSFATRCYICKVVLHPGKEYTCCNHCDPVSSSCYNFYAVRGSCILCKQDIKSR